MLPENIIWCGRVVAADDSHTDPERRYYPLNRAMGVELRCWANGGVRVEVNHRLERGWLITWTVTNLTQLQEDLGVLSLDRIDDQLKRTRAHLQRLKQLRKLTCDPTRGGSSRRSDN